VPHNPRRRRDADPAEPELTAERIAGALAEAVALRRRTAIDPAGVRPVALTPSETNRSTKQRRAPVPWDQPEERSPWVLVGWIRQEHGWAAVDGARTAGYDRWWDVRLHRGDGRVRLTPNRQGRRDRDDPYP
jgi:hypothetical protein